VALSPGIPTSFVPKQPVQAPKRKVSAGNNIFLFVSLGVAFAAVVAAGAVFAFDRYQIYVEGTKDAQLKAVQTSVNAKTVEDFIRLKNRFVSANSLLDNHLVLSSFFDELEGVTLQNVQFTDLTLTVAGDGTAKIQMNGVAKNFNALAVESNTVAADKKIKRAIFSGIGFDSSTPGTASRIKFQLSADLDKSLIVASAGAASAVAPAATATVGGTGASVPSLPLSTAPAATSSATSTKP
jgi:hypothetical protein